MTLKTDFQATAVELFDLFGSMVVDGTYVKETSTYVAGGSQAVTRVEHNIRLLRDTKKVTITLAQDIPLNARKYMLIVAELAVEAKAKDKLIIGGVETTILAVESDPGDIVCMVYVE